MEQDEYKMILLSFAMTHMMLVDLKDNFPSKEMW